MKARYRMFRRGARYYLEDVRTGRQTSLLTGDRLVARRLLAAKNEAVAQPEIRLAIAKANLATCDPRMVTRTWRDVMEAVSRRGKDGT